MADFASPQLIMTTAGLNAANAASPYGPWVHITSFKIGSAYGYDPQKIPSDTDIDGDLLYSSVPTQYKNLGNGVLDIVLKIPADAGPFEFGEIGLYNKDDEGVEHLFAKAVFDAPLTKYSSLGTNVASSFTIHALIKLEQSIAVFKIDTLVNNAVMEVDRWSDVLLPYLSADPDTPLLLVRELDAAGCSSLLHYSVPNEEKWTIGTNYMFVFSSTVSNSSAFTLRVPAADVQDTYYSDQDTKYVLEVEGRNDPYRVCSSLVKQGADAVFTIKPAGFPDLPAPGTKVRVYEATSYKSYPLATNNIIGTMRAGPGLQVNVPGVVETYGLLHGVQNSGRILTAADNLNANPMVPGNMPSGIYAITSSSMPAGMVPGIAWPGHIEIKNYGTGSQHCCHVLYWPAGTGGTGSSTGENGYPPYWKSWITTGSGSGYWSNWFPITTRGKRGPGSAGGLTRVYSSAGVFSSDTETIYVWLGSSNGGDGYRSGGFYAYINGVEVMRVQGGDWFAIGHQSWATLSGTAGAVWSVSAYTWIYSIS